MVYEEWIPIYEGLVKYYREANDPEQAKFYFVSLHRYSATEVRVAARKCCETLNFFPYIERLKAEIPVKRKSIAHWDGQAGVDTSRKPAFAQKGKYDCSHLSDEEVLAALMKQFGEYWIDRVHQYGPDSRLFIDENGIPSQARNSLKEVRKGIDFYCREVIDGTDKQMV